MIWIEFAGVLVLTFAVLAARLTRSGRRRIESETLALVRRRRQLRDELQRVVPDDDEASRLLQSTARRLGVSGSSPEALQAAIDQALQPREDKTTI